MACPCATPFMVAAGVAAAEGVRRATRCAGVGAAGMRAEGWTLLAAVVFGALALLAPEGCAAAPAAALAACLLWPNKRWAPAQQRRPRAPAGAYRSVAWREAVRDCPRTGDQYLVIGVGFFGKRLVRRLRERGEQVRVLDLCPDPFDAALGVDYRRGSALSEDDLRAALAGVDCVFATFAAVRYMDRLDFQADAIYKVNVTAMERVVELCRAAGVRRLVQTSTSHVIATVGHTRPVMDERDPYVEREQSFNHYSWTKALSEELVLAADCEQLRTVAVRPCSAIFGCDDNAVCDQMKGAFIPMPHPAARTDYVYVDNVVLGHLKADARLREGAPGIGGEAFCCSNAEPMSWEELAIAVQRYRGKRWGGGWDFRIALPALLMMIGSHFVEFVHYVSRGRVTLQCVGCNLFTPACLETAGLDFHVDIAKARRLLNYHPCWSVDEGVQQMIAEWDKRPDAAAVWAGAYDAAAESPQRRGTGSESASEDAITPENCSLSPPQSNSPTPSTP